MLINFLANCREVSGAWDRTGGSCTAEARWLGSIARGLRAILLGSGVPAGRGLKPRCLWALSPCQGTSFSLSLVIPIFTLLSTKFQYYLSHHGIPFSTNLSQVHDSSRPLPLVSICMLHVATHIMCPCLYHIHVFVLSHL